MTNLLPGAKPLNVLLLENDPADAELCLHELRKAGFNMRSDLAANVEEFRLKVCEGNYDVILAGNTLGGSNGIEAFEYLKEKDLQIPFILVTRAAGDEIAVECMKRGISDYVLKEHLARLPVAVQHTLEEGSLRRERTQSEKMLRENERRLNEDLEARVEERTAQLEAANQELQVESVERRRAGNILRESQECFRLFVDAVKDYAITMLDPQGRVASWNAGAERIQGYRAEEITGKRWSLFYPEDEVRAGHPEHDLEVAAAEGRQETACWSIRKDGGKFWANIVITATRDSSGKLTGFSTVTQDITERDYAQQALGQLRLQQELILNSAGEGICGLDASTLCTLMNPAGARMLGWKPEALIGKSWDEVWRHTKPGGPRGPQEECQILAALKSGVLRKEASTIVWRKDGSSFPVDFVVTPIRSEPGQILGAVVVFHDVTERLALERMKDEFISLVSHELRTPLTAIRGALGLLASGKLCLPPGGCQAMIEVGVSNADRLVLLVNDILDFGRIESGHVKLEKKVCASAGLMTQAADSMRIVAEAQGISLSVIPSSATLSADPGRIMQVLTNLIDNALKSSSRSSVIRLSAETTDSEVVFRVEDGGRGIPADKLTSIFEKFQQVDASDSRERGGTGLGLSICRSIVAQHGGRIWAESTLGEGSIFSFALPLGDTAPGSRSEVNQNAAESVDH